jgi:hypothetical protein
MDLGYEALVATVKFNTLVKEVAVRVTGEPHPEVIRWLNAWLGPHWVLMPQADGIAIYMGSDIVYSGSFSGFHSSKAVSQHEREIMNALDAETARLVSTMTFDFAAAIGTQITPALTSQDIQTRTQAFFHYYKTHILGL